MRKENHREQPIHNGPVERPKGFFAGQVSCMNEMTNAKNGLRAFGGLFLRMEKPLALEEEPRMSVKKNKYPQNWDNDDANTSQRGWIGAME